MEKTDIIAKIALLQRSAAEYERALLQQKDKIRRLRAAGDRTGEAETGLGHLQAYHDAILKAISAHLDRLDKWAASGSSPAKHFYPGDFKTDSRAMPQ
jgi:hypothetical protein